MRRRSELALNSRSLMQDGGIARDGRELAFGQAGALAGLTAELAEPKLKALITAAGFAEGTPAYNVLMIGAKSMIGAGVGAVPGAATAFNADANNRQLHPAEKARLLALAGDDPAKQQRLAAAACFLMKCSASEPAGSAAHDGFLRLERVGATLTAELALLNQQADARGQMFVYSYWNTWKDSAQRVDKQYSVLTRLGGGRQLGGGTASIVAGSSITATGLATCGPTLGAGCASAVGGALMVLWGNDQILAGSRAVVSGDPQYTLGARLIADATGISLNAAELWYALPGVATGGNAAQVATQASRQLAVDMRLSSATYGTFTPKGIQATDEVMNSPAVRSLVAELRLAGSSEAAARGLATEFVQSGSTALNAGLAVPGSTLFKIVPKGMEPLTYAPFWMSATQAQTVSRMTVEEAANFTGLPTAQPYAAKLNGGFDYIAITAKQGRNLILFSSKIASTEQRLFTQTGGAEQVIFPNRSLFTDAVKVQPKAPETFSPKRSGR